MSNEKIVINKESGIYKIFHFILGIVAVMVSYYYNKSLLWAIVHFIFSWIYLLYCLVIGRFSDGKFIEIIHHYI